MTVECSEDLLTSMDEKKKLVFSEDSIEKLRLAMYKLDELQQQCQVALEPTLEQHGLNSDKVTTFQIRELSRVLFQRASVDKTDVEKMEEDLQLFQIFKAAIKLVTKSGDENVQQLRDNLEHWLNSITPVMIEVLQRNGISPPKPTTSAHVKETLNKQTKDFLEFVSDNDKENVVVMERTPIEEDLTDNYRSAVCDVRNYVTVRDLGTLLLIFKKDFGHATRRS